MLQNFFILFFLCEITVESWTRVEPTNFTSASETTNVSATVAAEETMSNLHLVATPDYPVAAGQRVHLHCFAVTMPYSVIWSWQRLENGSWTEVNRGQNLILTKPEQSGTYRCRIETTSSQEKVSGSHAVFIVSMHLTAAENLGIAAIILMLPALILSLAVFVWLKLQRPSETLTTSNTAAEGFTEHDKSSKLGLPNTDNDEVYMNYTNINESYTDLDPTNMTGNNVYSSLS